MILSERERHRDYFVQRQYHELIDFTSRQHRHTWGLKVLDTPS